MQKKTNSKFSLAIIMSILLHTILIAMLGYTAWQRSSLSSNTEQGKSIDAIMIDTNIVSKQRQNQLKHKLDSEKVKKTQQEQIEKQAETLQKNLLDEQRRQKEAEKQRLDAIERQKIEQEAIKKALEEKQKIEQDVIIAKQKSEEEEKLRAQKALEEKARIDKERQEAEQEKRKAQAEAALAKQEAEKQKQLLEQQRLQAEEEKQAKLKIANEMKKKAQEEQNRQKAVDDLLGGLTSSAPQSQQSVSDGELALFRSQINSAISSKFVNPKLYNGKHCLLKIKIAQDGLVLSVTAQQGDGNLCREAISATKLAKLPKPKNELIYQKVKNLEIDFSPK